MTGSAPDSDAGFDFLADPVLVVTLDGQILQVNAAAKSFFGAERIACGLARLMGGGVENCERYLRLASRSTSPTPGKLSFAGLRGTEQFMAQAARSRKSGVEPQVILRLLPPASDRFAMLDRRVKYLDAQLHKRLQENAALQEALRQNKTLLSELQHRVKNNIQLMMSLIKMAAQGQETTEVAAVVETSHGRLRAMAAAQEALYQSDAVNTVASCGFLEGVVLSTARAVGAADALKVSLDDVDLSSEEAHCLALIANELITNAAKYGLRNGLGRIDVAFYDDGDTYRFEVEDDGPGMPEGSANRSSGLALVRALCRQISGRLEISRGKGTKCSVQFRPDRSGRNGP